MLEELYRRERLYTPPGNQELLEELEDPDNYRQWFKDKCFLCGKKILAEWRHYKYYGNACAPCNLDAAKSRKTKYEHRDRFKNNSPKV